MLNNLENKVENLNSAMKKLASNELATKSDLNLAFNELTKSLESISSLSSDQFAKKFLDSFRYLLEEKNRYLQASLTDFQEFLEPLKDQKIDKNFTKEIERISEVLTSIFGKFDEQEHIFLNLSRSLESVLKSNNKEDLDNLRADFAAFSNGLSDITGTINKNFNFFLAEIEKINPKNDLSNVSDTLEALARSVNTIISSVDIIDNKYQDMKSVVDLITNNESTLSLVLQEFKTTSASLEGVLPRLRKASTTEDVTQLADKINFIASFLGNLREFMETSANQNIRQLNEYSVSLENKIMSLQGDGQISRFEDVVKSVNERIAEVIDLAKDDLTRNISSRLAIINDDNRDKLSTEFLALKDNFRNLSSEIVGLDNTLNQNILFESRKIKDNLSSIDVKLSDAMSGFKSFFDEGLTTKLVELEDNTDRLNRENYQQINSILSDNLKNLENLFSENSTKSRGEIDANVAIIKKEVKTILLSLMGLKDDFEKVNAPNNLRDIVEQAILKIDESPTGNELKHIGEEINRVSQKLNGIFGAIEDNFDKLETSSSVEILQKINGILPVLVQNLDDFKGKLQNDNSVMLSELKKYFNDVVDTVKANVDAISSNVKSDNKTSIRQSTQELRQDLQTLSNNLTDSFENINSGIIREFVEQKEKIDNLTSLLTQSENEVKEKVDSFKSFVESNSYEIRESLQEAITASVIKYTEHLNNVATDILSKITAMDDFSNATYNEIENRINSMISTVLDNHSLTLQDEFGNFNAKLDKINSLQGNISKELVGEINNLANMHSDESVAIKALMQKMDTKFSQSFELPNVLKENLDFLQKNIVQEVKDELFKQNQSFNTGFTRLSNSSKSAETGFADLNNQIDVATKNLIQNFQGEFQKQYQTLINGFAKLKADENPDNALENSIKEQIDLLSSNLIREFKSELQQKIEQVVNDFTTVVSSLRQENSINILSDKIDVLEKGLNKEFKEELVNLAQDLQQKSNLNDTNLRNLAERVNTVTDIVALKFKNELETYKDSVFSALDKIQNIQSDNYNAVFELRTRLDDLVSSKEILSSILNIDEKIVNMPDNSGVLVSISDKIDKIPDNSQKLDDISQKIDDLPNHGDKLADISNKIDKIPDNSQKLDDISNKIDNIPNGSAELANISNKIDNIPDNTAIIANVYDKVSNLPDNSGVLDDISNKIDNIPDNSQKLNVISNKIDNIPNNSAEIADISKKIDDLPNHGDKLDYISQKIDNIPNNSMAIANISNKIDSIPDNSQKLDDISHKIDDLPNHGDKLDVISNKIDSLNNNSEILDKMSEIAENASVEIDFSALENKLDDIQYLISNSLKSQFSDIAESLNTVDNFESKLNEISYGVTSEIKDEIHTIIENLDDFSVLYDKIDEVSKNISESFSANFKHILPTLSNIDSIDVKLDVVSKKIADEVNTIISEIPSIDGILSNISNVKADTSNIIEKVDGILDKNAELSNKMAGFENAIENGISKISNEISDNSNDVSAKIDDNLNSLFERISSLVKDEFGYFDANLKSFEGIETKIQNISTSVTEKFEDEISKLAKNLKTDEIVDKIKSNFSEISDVIRNDLHEKMNSVLDNFDSLPDYSSKLGEISNILTDFSTFDDKFDRLTDKIKEEFQNTKADFSKNIAEISTIKENLDNVSSSIKDKIDSFVDSLAQNLDMEFKGQTSLLRSALDKIDDLGRDLNVQELLSEIHAKILEIQSDEKAKNASYNLNNVQNDFGEIKNMIANNDISDVFKNINMLKAMTSNNIKLNQNLDQQLSYVNNWLRGAAEALEVLAHKVDKIEKTSFDSQNLDTGRFDTIALNLLKKFKTQEARVVALDEKMNALMQKPSETTDMSAFIKVFHENVTYTKGLASRIDIIESQMTTIQKSLEQIITYIEE